MSSQPSSSTHPVVENSSSSDSVATIKASKAFRQLLGGGGNNKVKVAKTEQVFYGGRGGARRPKKPVEPTGPTNAERINALLASVSDLKHQAPSADSASFVTTNTESTGSSDSSGGKKSSLVSKHSVKVVVKQVLGSGGNDHGDWKVEPQVTYSYGRGGTAAPKRTGEPHHVPSGYYSRHSFASTSAFSHISALSVGRTDSPSLSISQNPDGLFFFGDGYPDASESSLNVGPGVGIFRPSGGQHPHPYGQWANAHPQGSMARTNASKLTVKSAVKEVFGGGGNELDEWKYLEIFHPGFGRGGEGAKMISKMDNNCLVDLTHFPYNGNVPAKKHLAKFPSANVFDDDGWDHTGSQEGRGRRRRANSTSSSIYGSIYSSVTELPIEGATPRVRARANSEGTSNPVHSEDLLKFRQRIQDGRRLREEARLADELRAQVEAHQYQEASSGAKNESKVLSLKSKGSISSFQSSISAFSSVSKDAEETIPPHPRCPAPPRPSSASSYSSHTPRPSTSEESDFVRQSLQYRPPTPMRRASLPSHGRTTSPVPPVPIRMGSVPIGLPNEASRPHGLHHSYTGDRSTVSPLPTAPSAWRGGYDVPTSVSPPPQYVGTDPYSMSPFYGGPPPLSSYLASASPPELQALLYHLSRSPSPMAQTPHPSTSSQLPDPASLTYTLALAAAAATVKPPASLPLSPTAVQLQAEREAIEKERRILAEERKKLEERKKGLSAKLKGLKKEVKERERTIEGLQWLVEEVSSSAPDIESGPSSVNGGDGGSTSGSATETDEEDYDLDDVAQEYPQHPIIRVVSATPSQRSLASGTEDPTSDDDDVSSILHRLEALTAQSSKFDHPSVHGRHSAPSVL